ncbi:MAG: hypothetical protein KGI08_10465 [Thaumarchaeota archaeon]|nr:hypothetical protein [Nitrososphaerota archaeon]
MAVDTPPTDWLKGTIQEIEGNPKKVAMWIWKNRETLGIKEGTRKFWQPSEAIDRPNKPSDTFSAKKSSAYPHVPEESPKGSNKFRSDAPDAEPANEKISETWPFTKENELPFGMYEDNDPMAQKPMPMQHMPGMIPGKMPPGGMGKPPMPNPMQMPGLGEMPEFGDMQSMPMDTSVLEEHGDENSANCPICKDGFDNGESLTKHLEDEHKVYEARFPFAREIPSPMSSY